MSDHITMGITVEELQARIKHVYELSLSQEGVNLKEETDKLKHTIRNTPEICQRLLPEDIGMLVHMVRGFHAKAREEGFANTAAGKKKAQSESKKSVTAALKKPITAEQLKDEFGDL